MSNIWYYHDEENGEWFKLKYRPDLSGLEDIFEFMEDGEKHRKGMLFDFYYGTMGKCINEGILMTEEEWMKKTYQ